MTTTYNVYRATVSGGPYTQIATALAAKNYVDSAAPSNQNLYYCTTSVVGGIESVKSKEVAAINLGNEIFSLLSVVGYGRRLVFDCATAANNTTNFTTNGIRYTTDSSKNVITVASAGLGNTGVPAWTVITNAVNFANTDVKIRYRYPSSGDQYRHPIINSRYTTTDNGFSGNYYMPSLTQGLLFAGGNNTSNTILFNTTGYYWLRVVTVRDYIFTKVWADGGAEPTLWGIARVPTTNTNGTNYVQMGKINLSAWFQDTFIDTYTIDELLSNLIEANSNATTVNSASLVVDGTAGLADYYTLASGVTSANTYNEDFTDSTGLIKHTIRLHAANAGVSAGVNLILFNANIVGPATFGGAPNVIYPTPRNVAFGPYTRIRAKSKGSALVSNTGHGLGAMIVNYYTDKASSSSFNSGRNDYARGFGPNSAYPADAGFGTWPEYVTDYLMPISKWDIVYQQTFFCGIHDPTVTGDFNFWDFSCVTIYPATLAPDGQTLTIDYGLVSAGGLLPASGVTGFVVKVNGTVVGVANVTTSTTPITDGNPGPSVRCLVMLTLATPVSGTALVTVTKSGGNLTDSSSNIMPDFAGQEVTNNSSVS